MVSLEEFKNHFKTTVKPILEELEGRRKGMHNRRVQFGGLAIVLIFCTWVLVFFQQLHPYTLPFMLVVAPGTAYFFYLKHVYDPTLADDYKELVIKQMLLFIDPSLDYQATSYIPYDDWRHSRLFPLIPDHYEGDDLIEGMIDGVPVKLSEIIAMNEEPKKRVKKERQQKKGSRFTWPWKKKEPREVETIVEWKEKKDWKIQFHGVFLVATIPTPIEGRIFILPDPLQKNLGYTGRLIQQNNLLRGHYIHPKNYDFRKKFVVYADHFVEGEKFLTSAVMNKMLLFQKRSKSKVYASIIGDKVSIAVDLRKEIFKVDTTRPLLKPKLAEAFYSEMLYLVSIVDDLGIADIGGGHQPQQEMEEESEHSIHPPFSDDLPDESLFMDE